MTGRSIISPKQYSNRPIRTLSFLENDDDATYQKTITEKEKKTEKSVHFASSFESFSESDQSILDSLQTSKDIISWLPSEHLYSDDTFISESCMTKTELSCRARTESKDAPGSGSVVTEPSYGTSTFIALESEDETKTASEFSDSASESLASSEVFSSLSQTPIYKEWRDVTEIVKDIEELEESEFVTRIDLELDDDSEKTIDSESENEALAEMAQQDFLTSMIRQLQLKNQPSPHSLAMDSDSAIYEPVKHSYGNEGKETSAFCHKMIRLCKSKRTAGPRKTDVRQPNPMYMEAKKRKNYKLEEVGLSSAVINRLKVENLHQRLSKDCQKLDKEIQESEDFVQSHQHIEEEHQHREFLSRICAQVQNEKSEERIQEHLTKMHPVIWFSQLVSQLPPCGLDSWDLLYKYKKLVESRMDGDGGTLVGETERGESRTEKERDRATAKDNGNKRSSHRQGKRYRDRSKQRPRSVAFVDENDQLLCNNG